MKVCERGWEYAQIFGEYGDVEICSWASMNYTPIGRLTEQSMYDIWHGEKAERFRQSLVDGSYCYCEKEKCPWMANGTLEEHMKDYDEPLEYPIDVSLSYERTCNYTCTCCADNENIRPKVEGADKNMEKIQAEVGKFIDNVRIISANGRGELFASKNVMQALHDWKPTRPAEEIHVVLETNGSLFDEAHWKMIENLGQYDLKVSITVMSFEERAYRYLSGTKLPVKRICDNLHFVQRLREQNIVNDFEIGTVIQERNFREMPEFSRRCIEEFGVDRVRLRPYFPWGELDEGIKWLYDIRNPYHPYYQEYLEVMSDPILKHPKVFMWSGDEKSSFGKHPYRKDKENFEVIRYLAADRHIGAKIKGYFAGKGWKKAAIHGFGYAGEAFANILVAQGLKIEAIVDRAKAGEVYEGITMRKLGETELEKDTPIIVTAPFFFEEIREEIQCRGLENPVINLRCIVDELER